MLFSQPARSIDLIRPPVFGAKTQNNTKEKINLPADYLVRVKRVLIKPRQVIAKDYYFLPDSFRRYNHKMPHVGIPTQIGNKMSISFFSYNNILDESAFYFDGEHSGHYGHFIMETLPRLWCWDEFDLTNLRFVTHDKKPFVKNFLVPFGISEENLYELKLPTLVKDLLIAKQPYVLEKSISFNAKKVWKHISDFFDKRLSRGKVYVSRLKFGKQRILINENEVEDVFKEYGFNVIYPEELPIEEQIDIFRNAEIIAGPSGSALYNLVFAKEVSHALILVSDRFITLNDALINHGEKYKITYISGYSIDDHESGMKANWRIDLRDIHRVLRKIGS